MNSLRDKDPKRRKIKNEGVKYTKYKHHLKADFNNCCGYCDDEDSWAGGFRVFQIDHFVPKKHLVKIKENDYQNLVYSCFYCNNKKRADWPSGDEKIHNDGKKGYIDPCSKDYSKQFKRNDLGEIKPITSLGRYMFEKLNLYLRRHAVIWNLRKLDYRIKELNDYYKKGKFKTNHELVKFTDLLVEYYKKNSELRIASNQ